MAPPSFLQAPPLPEAVRGGCWGAGPHKPPGWRGTGAPPLFLAFTNEPAIFVSGVELSEGTVVTNSSLSLPALPRVPLHLTPPHCTLEVP